MDDLLDPGEKVEIALLRAEHQKRYQVMINYLKEKVGDGVEYRNDVVRVVLSDNGVYYELVDLPEEFSGAVGEEVESHFVSREEVMVLLEKVVASIETATAENTRQFSLLALYSRRGIVDRKNCYVYEFRGSIEEIGRVPLEIGKYQPGVMPLFFKLKIDADTALEMTGFERGVLFCMSNAGDRHLLVRIPYAGKQFVDLGTVPGTNTVH